MDLIGPIIADDQIASFRKVFLASGKGRRPDLPPGIVVNNKLLLQLHQLRLESENSWTQLQAWFLKIKPNVEPSRIRPLVEKTVKQFQSLSSTDHHDFLATVLDLDSISPELSELGITRSSVCEPPPHGSFTERDRTVSNKVIVDLFHFCNVDRSANKEHMYQWLMHFCKSSKRAIASAVQTTMAHFKKHQKTKKSNPQNFENFLEKDFIINGESETSESEITPQTKRMLQEDKLSEKAEPKRPKLSGCHKDLEVEVQIVKDLLREESSTTSELTETVSSLRENSETLLKENEDLKSELKKLKHKMWFKERKVTDLKDNIESVTSEQNLNVSNLQKEINSLNAKLENKDKKIKELKRQVNELSCQNQSLTSKLEKRQHLNDIQIKSGINNAFSDNVRQATMLLIAEAGVSAGNVSKVIQIVAKHIFDHEITEDLPSKQTAIDINAEGLVLSNIQVTEKILTSDNVTLHLDGTSRDHKKYLSHQVTVDDGSTLFLGFTPVAVEDSSSVLDETINELKNIVKCYSEYSADTHSEDETLLTCLKKITSTMTDRASTMKSFDEKLVEFLKSETGQKVHVHFLHCNAHFLLGLSSSCDKALQSCEKHVKEITGNALGRDKDPQFSSFQNCSETATNRLIRTLCDILGNRGDQKNGCKELWREFCPNSRIPSFKSNRFNCFFEAAAAIIFHYEEILRFFNSGVLPENVNQKIKSVSLDVQDKHLMACIVCLALFYVQVSAPYWNLVNSSVLYTDFHQYVKLMHDTFLSWVEDPSNFLNLEGCLFGEFFSHSLDVYKKSIHQFLKSENCDHDILMSIVPPLVKECLAVTERQLSDFLTGQYSSEVDDSVRVQLQHCPLTNLVGESSFGDLDHDINKRANCSSLMRSASHCIKRNKTASEYLDSQNKDSKARLFATARKMGRTLKEQCKAHDLAMSVKTKERMLENQQTKVEKEIDKINKHEELWKRLDSVGGVCTSRSSLIKLQAQCMEEKKGKKETLEIFKDHIRYFKSKYPKNSKQLTMNGTVDDIIERLVTFFESDN